MQYFLAGKDVSIRIPIRIDETVTIPEVGSVSYTVMDKSGTPISGQIDVPVTTTSTTTQVAVSVPGSANAIVGRLENRTILLQFRHQGQTYYSRVGYRLVPFLNFSLSPENVRVFLGINRSELPDSDIDFVAAYFEVEEVLGQSALETALSSISNSQKANDLIFYRTVLNLIPSISLRIAKSETDGTKKFERIAELRLDRLEEVARTRYGYLMGALSGTTDTTGYIGFVVMTGTDPFTGV